MPEQLLTPEQVAETLNMHIDTIRRLLRESRLPGVKIGVGWRTSRAELARWIAKRSHDGNLPRVVN